ncbi:acyl dehydratase [Alteromonadaceae bacterium 2753L.S.0a.02]|nr:acyl dehydratase [Alteromonadaceae bacterium 2753L.S.0a.02]
MRRLEPQVRELKESFNQSVSNSFANTFFSRFITVANEEIHPAVTPIPAVITVVTRLQSILGQEIHVGEWHEVDQYLINNFADVTGDDQWIHTDTERAEKESPFKATVAHGFLVLSMLPKLRGLDSYAAKNYPEARMIVNCGMNEVRYLNPVKVGSAIRSRTFLRKIEPNKRSIDLTEEVIVDIHNSKKEALRTELLTRIYL